MNGTAEEARLTIERLAVESFAKHVIKQTGQNEWRCAAPGTWAYGFVVICRPCYVVVFGDIGDWVLQHSGRDSLAWLRGSVRDAHYVLGKLRVNDREQEFYCGDARAYLDAEIERLKGELIEDEVAEDPEAKRLLAVKEEINDWPWSDGSDFPEYVWREGWANHGEREPPDCRAPSSGGLWLTEALRWFVAHVDQAEVPLTLEQRVRARLGECGYFELACCQHDVRIEWRRDYHGVTSDLRTCTAFTIEEALAAVLRWEDEADAKDGGNR